MVAVATVAVVAVVVAAAVVRGGSGISGGAVDLAGVGVGVAGAGAGVEVAAVVGVGVVTGGTLTRAVTGVCMAGWLMVAGLGVSTTTGGIGEGTGVGGSTAAGLTAACEWDAAVDAGARVSLALSMDLRRVSSPSVRKSWRMASACSSRRSSSERSI